MKTHSYLGYLALEQAEQDAEQPLEFLKMAKDITYYHHERWDGTGYPKGLAGNAIPISARLMAVADVFDAQLSRRSYKEPFDVDRAISIIAQEKSTHFDPDIVDAFLAEVDQFITIAKLYEENCGFVERA